MGWRVCRSASVRRKVSAATLLLIPDVPWKNVKGMRDWIAHDYGRVNGEST